MRLLSIGHSYDCLKKNQSIIFITTMEDRCVASVLLDEKSTFMYVCTYNIMCAFLETICKIHLVKSDLTTNEQ